MHTLLHFTYILENVLYCFIPAKGVLFEKAIMYGPLNTSQLSNVRSFFDETKEGIKELPNGPLLSFTIQVPIEPMEKNSANGK